MKTTKLEQELEKFQKAWKEQGWICPPDLNLIKLWEDWKGGLTLDESIDKSIIALCQVDLSVAKKPEKDYPYDSYDGYCFHRKCKKCGQPFQTWYKSNEHCFDCLG